jgi:hypothetical protein
VKEVVETLSSAVGSTAEKAAESAGDAAAELTLGMPKF